MQVEESASDPIRSTIDVFLIVAKYKYSVCSGAETMQFEWGEEKKCNIRLHKIDFADVPIVFNAPRLTDLDERIEYGEER
jgi:hypothetical protein